MRVLIAEDERLLANNIKKKLEKQLQGKLEAVHIVDNGRAALHLIRHNYDLLILDLKMPEMDGTQVIEALSESSPEDRPSVILITAYPGAYETARLQIKMGVQALLHKPFKLIELTDLVRDLVGMRRQLLLLDRQGVKTHCKWTLGLNETGLASVRVGGLLSFADSYHLPWNPLDLERFSQNADLVKSLIHSSSGAHGGWTMRAKELGADLYKRLFVERIGESFVKAGGLVLHPNDLKLTFVCPRDFLRLPLELLNDGFDYLVLRHPLKRFITGVYSKGRTGLTSLLKELQEKRQPLRMLVIAANTHPLLPGVEEEVAIVESCARRAFAPHQAIIDVIPPAQATYEEVVRRLEGCPYHILHYAGHAVHDPERPRDSGLVLRDLRRREGWEEHPCEGVEVLTLEALKNTLRRKGHSLRFVYLSCCHGTASSPREALLSENFLGTADALVQVGVPSVFGFRWPVSDAGAREMACSFYESLLEQRELDVAVFQARCRVAGRSALDDTGDWLSPMLIVQET